MTTLEISYIALTLFMTAIVLFAYNYAMGKAVVSNSKRKKNLLIASSVIVGWWIYTYLLSMSGILNDFSLPPRFPIFLIFPLFIFTGVLFYKKRKSKILQAIPRSWPIYVQSFRVLVEVLFVYSVAAGVLHKEVTIEGYNYDMILGFSAILVGLLVYTFRLLPERIALIWNYLGLLVLASIIFLFTTTVFFPSVWGQELSLAPEGFLDFPYILVASYLMPLAVFIHVFSIVQFTNRG